MNKFMLGALAVLSLAAPAMAKEKPPVFVEDAPVKDKPVAVIDPAKAYLLVRSDGAVPLYLMKIPTAEDQAVYDKLRAEGLAEAKKKYVKKLASYERDRALAAQTRGMTVPKKPIEPTEENFEFTPFELLASVGIGPFNRFAKGDGGVSTYLQEVTPASYRIYGMMSVLPGAAPMGNCFCMGSVRFDAKAGQIVDLGLIQTKSGVDRPKGDSAAPLNLTGQKLFEPVGNQVAVDPRLAKFTIIPAAYKPVGKLPNYFGLTITRLPAIPGVMRYDRDKIVDLTGRQ